MDDSTKYCTKDCYASYDEHSEECMKAWHEGRERAAFDAAMPLDSLEREKD